IPGADAGEWFMLEVLARGNRITIKVNGHTTVSEFEDSAFQRGHLALQQAGAETIVHFRKIEIKELPAKPLALPRKAADVPAFLPGTWKLESVLLEPKVPADQARATGICTHDLVAGGKFVRGCLTYDNGQFESLVVQQYDAGPETIRGWFFTSRGECNGPG